MDQKQILAEEIRNVKDDILEIQEEIDGTTFKITHEQLSETDKKDLSKKLKALNKEMKGLIKNLTNLTKSYEQL